MGSDLSVSTHQRSVNQFNQATYDPILNGWPSMSKDCEQVSIVNNSSLEIYNRDSGKLMSKKNLEGKVIGLNADYVIVMKAELCVFEVFIRENGKSHKFNHKIEAASIKKGLFDSKDQRLCLLTSQGIKIISSKNEIAYEYLSTSSFVDLKATSNLHYLLLKDKENTLTLVNTKTDEKTNLGTNEINFDLGYFSSNDEYLFGSTGTNALVSVKLNGELTTQRLEKPMGDNDLLNIKLMYSLNMKSKVLVYSKETSFNYHYLHLWNLETNEFTSIQKVHQIVYTRLKISDENLYWAGIHYDGITVGSMTGEIIGTYKPSSQYFEVHFSPDNETIYFQRFENIVDRWNIPKSNNDESKIMKSKVLDLTGNEYEIECCPCETIWHIKYRLSKKIENGDFSKINLLMNSAPIEDDILLKNIKTKEGFVFTMIIQQ